jgi:hypothetical protein
MGLCTAAQVKAYATNVPSSSMDGLIDQLITAESAAIERFLQRTLTQPQNSVAETYDGNGGFRLPLNSYPIASVDSVVVDGTTWDASWYTHDLRGLVALEGRRWTRGRRNVVVTYKGGYTTIPSDIQQACVELVCLRLEERKRQGISSQSIAGESVSYSSDPMPASVVQKLKPYLSYAG